MSAAFKVGDVCIWQNCTGKWAYLNGTETTVTGELEHGFDLVTGEIGIAYPTDTQDPTAPPGFFLLAGPHELRKKQPPTSGEQLIREMFDVTPARVAELA